MVPEIVMEVIDKLKGLIPIYLICESFTIPSFTYYLLLLEKTRGNRTKKEQLDSTFKPSYIFINAV